jgi:ABC-2 type transport system ATP-binding protein
MDAAIRTEELCKDYRTGFWRRRARVLRGLNLEVRAGEVFGYLGPNGAGKTTTLKLLMGLIHPTAGRATILGRDISEVDVKAQVGFLPENPYFYDYLTGREFLDYYGRLFALPGRARRERVDRLLHEVGMAHAAELSLRKYSKGMLQRIGLAQALINDPDLVVLDEPMTGLDPLGRKEVRDLILRLKAAGKTIFFSTHIIPDVEVICDRVGIIFVGELVTVGPLETLLGTHLESIEITFSGLPPGDPGVPGGPWARPPVHTAGRTIVAVADEATGNATVRALVERGATIHSVVPLRRTLEEEFVQQIEERRRAQGAGHRPEHLS